MRTLYRSAAFLMALGLFVSACEKGGGETTPPDGDGAEESPDETPAEEEAEEEPGGW